MQKIPKLIKNIEIFRKYNIVERSKRYSSKIYPRSKSILSPIHTESYYTPSTLTFSFTLIFTVTQIYHLHDSHLYNNRF